LAAIYFTLAGSGSADSRRMQLGDALVSHDGASANFSVMDAVHPVSGAVRRVVGENAGGRPIASGPLFSRNNSTWEVPPSGELGSAEPAATTHGRSLSCASIKN